MTFSNSFEVTAQYLNCNLRCDSFVIRSSLIFFWGFKPKFWPILWTREFLLREVYWSSGLDQSLYNQKYSISKIFHFLKIVIVVLSYTHDNIDFGMNAASPGAYKSGWCHIPDPLWGTVYKWFPWRETADCDGQWKGPVLLGAQCLVSRSQNIQYGLNTR